MENHVFFSFCPVDFLLFQRPGRWVDSPLVWTAEWRLVLLEISGRCGSGGNGLRSNNTPFLTNRWKIFKQNNYKGREVKWKSVWRDTGVFPWWAVGVTKHWLVGKVAYAAYHCITPTTVSTHFPVSSSALNDIQWMIFRWTRWRHWAAWTWSTAPGVCGRSLRPSVPVPTASLWWRIVRSLAKQLRPMQRNLSMKSNGINNKEYGRWFFNKFPVGDRLWIGIFQGGGWPVIPATINIDTFFLSRYFVAADGKLELADWLQRLNTTIEVLRMWGLSKTREQWDVWGGGGIFSSGIFLETKKFFPKRIGVGFFLLLNSEHCRWLSDAWPFSMEIFSVSASLIFWV